MVDSAGFLALDARDRMAQGEFTAADYAAGLLARIEAIEPQVEAFTFFDADMVRARADELDRYRGTGRALGPLHGLAVGVKDIVDTADMPTENGTVIDAGRKPTVDAAIVSRLRAAGAIVAGKTVTTEFAYFHPGKTRNPINPEHTPGGSSSGSAAAVAAGMVPLATGTQTAGSVIRPASFCGVVGFKPTYGLIPRTGVLMLAEPLDTVGVFARSVSDAALLADVLAGHDPNDRATMPAPQPRLLEIARTDPPVTPTLAFVKTHAWDEADTDTRQGFAELVEALGGVCKEVALPDVFAEARAAQLTLMLAGIARNIAPYNDRGRDQLSQANARFVRPGQGDHGGGLSDRARLARIALRRAGAAFRQLRRDTDPGRSGGSAARTWRNRQTGLQCPVDADRRAGDQSAAASGQERPAGGPCSSSGRRGDDARLLRTANWLTRRVDGELGASGEAT